MYLGCSFHALVCYVLRLRTTLHQFTRFFFRALLAWVLSCWTILCLTAEIYIYIYVSNLHHLVWAARYRNGNTLCWPSKHPPACIGNHFWARNELPNASRCWLFDEDAAPLDFESMPRSRSLLSVAPNISGSGIRIPSCG